MIMHRLNNSQQFYKAQIKQNLIQNVFSETHLEKNQRPVKIKPQIWFQQMSVSPE